MPVAPGLSLPDDSAFAHVFWLTAVDHETLPATRTAVGGAREDLVITWAKAETS